MNASFYKEIKEILISARNKVYQTANFAMVEAYWNIGKSIIEEQGGNEKAEYGTGLLKELSKQMTQDFGKGFTVANLKNVRQFYLTFPNGYALRSELSWTHYRLLMRVENENAREFYMQEAVKSQWSTRQLERQINSFFYKLNWAVLISLALVLAVMFTPLSALFGLIRLPGKLYLIGLCLILVPVLVMEFSKAFGLIRHHH
ncbi:MAG TPA: cation transporting ATPase C-terminal domain-containing protein [Candidatus Scybalocola faecigallinarum]|uniref:Cation transporting ATPase C-terminal domain-containing protein n=1 Tax=Candidatus Scybalocola faecigallinarum TaxID=2840941 RepID=A0A9D1F2P1_9FIRM|nr:cation transporting ATPase C-terminal domain-containing protein [Candidatus Scybalocola faecigallinarum]